MEVHHHPIAIGSHTERRKWTHYFWEFLMLFLAVTLGFFVENQREHFIENKREKQYIRSLIIDLKKDTTNASLHLRRNISKFKGLDSLLNILNSNKAFDSAVTVLLYRLLYAYGRSRALVITNEITIQQLLSSGNVRLLRKKGVYDSLVSYQLRKSILIRLVPDYQDAYTKSFTYQAEIFKVRGYREILMNSDTSFTPVFTNNNLRFITTDRITLQKYVEATEVWRSVISSYIGELKILKRTAVNLLILLKKEYNLE